MEELILEDQLEGHSLPQAMTMMLQLMNMQCERALVSSDPTVTSLGTYEQAHVFSSKNGACVAFLANYHSNSAARVTFNNKKYDLPPWSISILPDCKTDVFNTARVRFQTTKIQMLPSNSKLFSWETYDEDVSSLSESSKITASGLLEQLNATRDTSDYLWYITSEDRSCTFNGPVNLRAGTNKIALLSVAVGLPNVGFHFETWKIGITGVLLDGLDHGQKDLTWQKWSYQGIMDSRLEGKFPSKAAFRIAQLALKCLASEPKQRSSMKEVLESLERIQAANEKPVEPKLQSNHTRQAHQLKLIPLVVLFCPSSSVCAAPEPFPPSKDPYALRIGSLKCKIWLFTEKLSFIFDACHEIGFCMMIPTGQRRAKLSDHIHQLEHHSHSLW
ncbi:hypothetical protein V8G54_026573 [Vigna mungo]|uniref:Beta-galactosidase beta-sandwich domain-containing protein n=1 Tax=Vigna mungo TaxID=3915 RepID=A0AAQ3RMA2_VIGMU